MREIVLDTETTGLDPSDGHRIIEVCCLELDNHLPTGRVYHTLIHPERDIPEESVRVHGLTLDKLAEAPKFGAIVDDLLAFMGDSRLVIHNAEFDLKFLNAEFARANREPLQPGRGIDTIALAKRRFPGARYSLDELCRRFNIDLSVRSKHGARVDSELLAQVYLELVGGRQARLQLAPGDAGTSGMGFIRIARPRPTPLPERLAPDEREAHARFIAGEIQGDVVWNWG
ncbi:MAG TPA: DNA polymerase III subunit epsilon [Micropepsaceae bacterium]|jgi:DNA polymerase-3 subunit epsilon|nr:DNA polymerase III subunit epsilon [Micropepsaceae bacterium]